MKIFSSEVGHNYDSYTFGYAQYAQKENDDLLADIYEKGYLPYSGSLETKDIFYMARSARVVLNDFELTSENRRIAKKFDGQFRKERVPISQFKPDEAFHIFCLSYFKERHGGKAMPHKRLEFLLSCGLITDISVYYSGSKPVAYVLEAREGAMGHYWFSFYDLSLVQQSLGLWLMLDCLRDAKTSGLKYYYLGTVYGEKALYKTNFEPLLWWDGGGWSSDVALLRERGRTDSERVIKETDTWKSGQRLF